MRKDLVTQCYRALSKLNNEKASNPTKNCPVISTEASLQKTDKQKVKTWEDATLYWSSGKHRFKAPWHTPRALQDGKHGDTRTHTPRAGRGLRYRKCMGRKQAYMSEPSNTAGQKAKCRAILETFSYKIKHAFRRRSNFTCIYTRGIKA